MLKSLSAVVGALALLASAAFAEGETPLTAQKIEAFIATLDAIDALGEEEGFVGDDFVDGRPKAGEAFKPYSKAVAVLRTDHPADHARIEEIVAPHGFSAESWAATGDRVTIAYIAEGWERDNPGAVQKMGAMDASMLSMLPANVRAEMEAGMAMVETVKNAPAADREAVRPYMSELETRMGED